MTSSFFFSHLPLAFNPLRWQITAWGWQGVMEGKSESEVAQLCPTLLCPWDSPGKSTGMGCRFLLQEIFPTRDGTRVSLIAGRCFTIWATRDVVSKSRVTGCGHSQVKCSLFDVEQIASEMEHQSATQNNGNLTCFLGIVYPVTDILLTFTFLNICDSFS